MQKKKWRLLLGIILGMLMLTIQARAASTSATFIFHDRTGSQRDEAPLIIAAQKDGVKLSILHAKVSAQGRVKLSGQLTKEAAPVIEVEFVKHEGSYSKMAQWSYQVIKQARAKWHFKTMNLVGIGTGNMGLLNCLTKYADTGQLPSLAKQVAVAGPFNGTHIQPNADSKLMKNGRPYHMNMLYQELLGLKKTYPKSSAVLNIYGNQSNHSDGTVANNSSRALRYLVTPRAKSYQEQEVKGTRTDHDQLMHNPQVQNAVISFLWK